MFHPPNMITKRIFVVLTQAKIVGTVQYIQCPPPQIHTFSPLYFQATVIILHQQQIFFTSFNLTYKEYFEMSWIAEALKVNGRYQWYCFHSLLCYVWISCLCDFIYMNGPHIFILMIPDFWITSPYWRNAIQLSLLNAVYFKPQWMNGDCSQTWPTYNVCYSLWVIIFV